MTSMVDSSLNTLYNNNLDQVLRPFEIVIDYETNKLYYLCSIVTADSKVAAV